MFGIVWPYFGIFPYRLNLIPDTTRQLRWNSSPSSTRNRATGAVRVFGEPGDPEKCPRVGRPGARGRRWSTHLGNWNITILFIGKSTIKWAMFNSYVTNYQRDGSDEVRCVFLVKTDLFSIDMFDCPQSKLWFGRFIETSGLCSLP